MTVEELRHLLRDMEPDAEVLVVHQRTYPFELSLSHVTTRRECIDDEEYEEGDRGLDGRPQRLDDVFLVEGGQAAYGLRSAWDF